MKMKHLIFAIFLLVLSQVRVVKAQENGIQFFNGTWDQAVEKSKKENKKIFLDTYIPSCGPCKILRDSTFKLAAVADYYNANFINVSLDMQQPENFSLHNRYAINVFPDLLYFKPGGFLIDRITGKPSGEELVSKAKSIVNSNSTVTLEEQFEKGGYRDSVFLRKYLAYAIENYNPANYQFILDDIIKIEGEDALYRKMYWDILGAATTGSKAGIFLAMNHDKFAKIYGTDAVDEKISSMYLNIRVLNDYQENLRDVNIRETDHKNDNPYDLLKTRLITRHVPNADFILACVNFYRACRANKRTEAFEIANKALINAKPWQYHQMALLADWLTAGRLNERTKVVVWATKAVNNAKSEDKKRYKMVLADLKQYAPDLAAKPMIYDFTI